MFKFNRKITLSALIVGLIIASGGGIFGFNYLNNHEKNTAKAQDVIEQVKEQPDAGIEALPAETMDSVKKSIDTYPAFLVKGELDRQLKEGYITQKQYKELNQMVDDHEAKQPVIIPTTGDKN